MAPDDLAAAVRRCFASARADRLQAYQASVRPERRGKAVQQGREAGTLAAHPSLVAREYGIPAVAGTGNATQVLRTGQLAIVDGSAGTVAFVGTGEFSKP